MPVGLGVQGQVVLKKAELKQTATNLEQIADWAESKIGERQSQRTAMQRAVSDLRELASRFLTLSHTSKDIA